MKKILVASALLFLTLITNAQTLEGEWKFVKMKLFGEMIYFDGSDKYKINLINSWIKLMTEEIDEKNEIEEMKKNINDNKALVYASAKEQFAGVIGFKSTKDVYDGNDAGKIYFNEMNMDDKMELVDAKIYIEDNILKLADKKRLFDSWRFEITLTTNKLILTDIEEPPMIIYYEKKS